jgi:hypothetical protein
VIARFGARPVAVQPEVGFVRGDAVLDRVGPADQLKPGRDLAVIPAGIITAAAADYLECVGVGACARPSTTPVGWRRKTAVVPSPG